MSNRAPVVLDACVCINAAAALNGPIDQLLGCEPVVVPQVVGEALCLHRRDGDDLIKVPVDLARLPMVELGDREVTLYVELAGRLDDGEAASMAVASIRSWALATDDRAARSAARVRTPPVDVVTTPLLIRLHAEAAGWNGDRIREAIRAVRQEASFEPPRDDPHRAWWLAHA